MKEFQLRYFLAYEDFLAFHKYVIFKRNRGAFALNASLTFLSMSLFATLAFYAVLHHWVAAAIGASVIVIVGFSLWLFFFFRRIRKVARAQATSASGRMERSVTLGPSGFREVTEENDSFHAWSGCYSVAITKGHLFVHPSAVTGYMVPRSNLDGDALALVRSSVPPNQLVDLVV